MLRGLHISMEAFHIQMATFHIHNYSLEAVQLLAPCEIKQKQFLVKILAMVK